MDNPAGIQLDELIGPTDRGILWRATRERKDDRIVRMVDPRFCDSTFREALADLRGRQFPRMIPIGSQGWSGVQFYVEYCADSPWETLDAHFQRLHWRQRLNVVREICDVLPQWISSPVHPLGLSVRNIVMMEDADHWFPWLLPCPALHHISPCDWFGCDSPIVSALAPEVIRGVQYQDRAQDMYALGNLAVHALGGAEAQHVSTDEERIEAQARGALLTCDLNASQVDVLFRNVESVKSLVQVIRRYNHTLPDARPMDPRELQAACLETWRTTDPLTLSTDLINCGRLRDALHVLEWALEQFGENLECRLLAADVCEKIGDLPRALVHLDHTVALASDDSGLRWRRCDLRWSLFVKLPPLPDGQADPEADLLLRDLNWLKNIHRLKNTGGYDTRQHDVYVRMGHVYRRRRDFATAANELYQAAEMTPSDMEALFLYGDSLKELGYPEEVAQVVNEAHRRIGRMLSNEMMKPLEAQQWRKNFNTLLSS